MFKYSYVRYLFGQPNKSNYKNHVHLIRSESHVTSNGNIKIDILIFRTNKTKTHKNHVQEFLCKIYVRSSKKKLIQ